MISSHHHQLPVFFPNLFQNHPVHRQFTCNSKNPQILGPLIIFQQNLVMYLNPSIASSAKIPNMYLKHQIKPEKMNKWPSRDRHRNGKNPRKPVRCVFYTKGGRLARDANGGPAGWTTNLEIKIHKSVEGRLYLICKYTNKYVLVFIYSGV
jgi:hypothetical protein